MKFQASNINNQTSTNYQNPNDLNEINAVF